MKRIICLLSVYAVLFCSSCVKQPSSEQIVSDKEVVALGDTDNSKADDSDDHIYTSDELWEQFGVIFEYRYSGWCDVYNETDKSVRMTISYPQFYPQDDLEVVITPGEYSRLMIGGNDPGWDFSICSSASFLLEDGTSIVFSPNKGNEWSNYFFTNVDCGEDYEIGEFEGKKVRHDMVTKTYHFNDSVIALWRSYNN